MYVYVGLYTGTVSYHTTLFTMYHYLKLIQNLDVFLWKYKIPIHFSIALGKKKKKRKKTIKEKGRH